MSSKNNLKQNASVAPAIVPAEWAGHKAMWTAWPYDPDMWPGNLEEARAEVAAMVRTLAAGDHVRVLACGEEAMNSAINAVGAVADVIAADYGDIWLRDTGPIWAISPEHGGVVANRFRTNGWGGKYQLEHDDTVGDTVAERAETPIVRHDFVLEGGSVDQDGEGTLLTTKQCVLNDNRNPGMTQQDLEEALCAAFGAEKVLWLDDGLLNDHTDGHIDNIARFIAPGHVLCQSPFGDDDPNTDVLNKIYRDLCGMTDAKGRKLKVSRIPSPGLVLNEDGDVIPASHANFIIGNRTIALPTYGTASADDAVAELAKLFPTRQVIGLPAHNVLSQGGSFHCITQQEPLP